MHRFDIFSTALLKNDFNAHFSPYLALETMRQENIQLKKQQWRVVNSNRQWARLVQLISAWTSCGGEPARTWQQDPGWEPSGPRPCMLRRLSPWQPTLPLWSALMWAGGFVHSATGAAATLRRLAFDQALRATFSSPDPERNSH